AENTDGLAVELDAGVLGALPLAALESGVSLSDIAGGGEDQGDGVLGGAGDIGGRCVHDHDAGLGRRLYVDVVEPHAGASDDAQLGRARNGLGVHLGGAANDQSVHVGERGQELRAVCSVG